MIYHLKIEAIGDGNGLRPSVAAKAKMIDDFFGSSFFKIPPRAWVAEVPEIRGKWVERSFVRGKKDYTHANSVGSRGVYLHYFLESGKVYEVSSPQSWKSTDRYFCRITDDGQLIKLSREEAAEWLQQRSDSASMS